MTHEDLTLPGKLDDPTGPDAPGRFDVAIRAVGELAMSLSSAISAVHFADALRLRAELGEALSHAAALAALPDPVQRAAAVQQLVAMRSIASRLFQSAPAPSAAALTAANAGDRTVLDREAQGWIAARLASATNPHTRARRDTQPESPRAWGTTRDADPDADTADDSICVSLVEPPSADEANAR